MLKNTSEISVYIKNFEFLYLWFFEVKLETARYQFYTKHVYTHLKQTQLMIFKNTYGHFFLVCKKRFTEGIHYTFHELKCPCLNQE